MYGEPARSRGVHEALVEFYYEGLSAATFVDRTFGLTSRLLDFSLNSHGVLDRDTGMLTAHFDDAPPGIDLAFSAFGRLMAKYPAFRFDPSVNGGRPFSARDFYSKPAFEDLDIHAEVYRPMRLTDHCFMHVPTGNSATVFVGFLRDGTPFDEDEKALLALVQPHLANGRRLAFAMTASSDIPITPELFARAGFTARECDVLDWLTRGKANEEIATLLGLRADSVSRHLRNIYAKLGVEHRVAATIAGLKLARELHAESLLRRSDRRTLVVPTRGRPVRMA